ncbi:DnaJ C-terminal domain-containing protein [Nannocystis exedens]|uniref:DnaJ C-terminal domain-containing protein n=1 Tax=Nannocystis exedens TaxID=54 RepID=UPI000BD88015|nr:DnaJ C-terminal domain-containing protein [Nannocystis exedens]PCC66480.1 Chaperone protein DnaJ [Nannocystis exedens]
MPSPYETLGVRRDASAAEVKAAWRRLRASLHPDRNKAATAQAQFVAARAAYELLLDPRERAAYDLLHPPVPGADILATLRVPVPVALHGGSVPLGDRAVAVPPGVAAGDRLRIRGAGEAGEPPGDLLVTVELVDDEQLRHEVRRDLAGRVCCDLVVDLSVTWLEALRGAVVAIPTPGGFVEEAIAPGTRDGHRFRVAGRGLGRTSPGDLVAIVRLVPPPAEPLLLDLLQLLQADAGRAARARLAEQMRRA